MLTSTLTSKGQATIPASVRKILGLKPGEKVYFEPRGDFVAIKKVPDFFSLMGSIKTRVKYTDQKADRAIGKMLSQRYKNTDNG